MVNTKSYTIRNATLADAEAMGRINVDAWRSTYTGIIANSVLDAMTYENYIKKWQHHLDEEFSAVRSIAVAEVNGVVVGYESSGYSRTQKNEYDGELFAIYLREQYHGRGIGKALFLEAMNNFQRCNIHSFYLYVLKNNTIGRKFYDSFAPDEIRDTKITIEESTYCDILYGWRSVEKIVSMTSH